jgi:hypothetical protein
MKARHRSRTVKVLTVLLSLIGSILMFQNCGKGFQANTLQTFDQASLLVPAPPPAPLATPEITIETQIPADMNSSSLAVKFAMNVDSRAAVASLVCQLDAAVAQDCRNGQLNLTNLSEGDHSLKINGDDDKGQKASEKIILFRVDTGLPVIAVSQAPAAVTNNGPIVIAFSATDAVTGVASVQCSLDNLAFANCTSPTNLSGLADGAHSFRIKALDKVGNSSAITNLNWTVNSAAPTVTLSAKPNAVTNLKTASFSFSGTAGGMALTSYECSVDGGAYAACTSPKAYTNVADGSHSFSVRGTSAANVLSSPVTANWQVDTGAPITPVISSNITSPTKLKALALVFSSSDTGSMIKEFQCSLDQAAFTVCTSPRNVSALADGNHSFRVKAIDNAGNESVIGSYTWSVDSVAPDLAFTSTPKASSTDTAASFVFTASDVSSGLSSVQCSIDAGAYASCTSPKNYTNLSVSAHTFSVKAIDNATNEKIVSFSWTVAPIPLSGAEQYAFSCAGCHGALASSTKLNKSSAEITAAIANVPAMMGINLPAAQIGLIADALATGPAGNFTPVACATPTNRGLDRPSIARLTKKEMVSTLTDLLGASVVSQVTAELAQIPEDDPMYRVDAFNNLHSIQSVEGVEGLAYRIGEIVSASTSLRTQIGGSCLGLATISQACFTTFIDSFGKKVLRRPLTTTEKTSYLAMSAARPNADGVHVILARLIGAPEMSFHIESGKSVSGNRVALTDYEIASRISYSVIGSMPDATLMAAADAGTLSNLANVESQVRRLLDSTKAQQNLKSMFSEWLHLSDQIQPPASVIAWGGVNGANLAKELNDEVFDYIFEVVWKSKGSFYDLMTRQIALPKTSSIAKIYGTNSTSGAPITSLDHPGLMFRAGVMVSSKKETSPILRSVFVKRQILCENLGAPPANAFQVADAVVLDPLVYPNHEIVTAKTSAGACIGCHGVINPTGFVMETYDPLGGTRTVESVIADNGQVLKTHALPPPKSIVFDGATRSIASPLEMAKVVGDSPNAFRCMSTYAFRHVSRKVEGANDSCAIQDMTNSLGTGQPVFDSIVKSIANEDIFWRGL